MYVSRKPKPCVDCGGVVEIDKAWRCKAGTCHDCDDRAFALRAGEERAAQRRRQRIGNQAAWARRKASGEFRTAGEQRYRSAVSRLTKLAISCGFVAEITAETRCEDCGKPAECYDHRDYSRPLLVAAVCLKCNASRRKGLMPERLVPALPPIHV